MPVTIPGMKQKKKEWGGKRSGAGRPKLPSDYVAFSVRIPGDIVAEIDKMPGTRNAAVLSILKEWVYDRSKKSGRNT